MTGFNLPPGCNVHDLPGNEPEDPAIEAIYTILRRELTKVLTEEILENLQTDIIKVVNDARHVAYTDGIEDESFAHSAED
jgi:hypothetical protein